MTRAGALIVSCGVHAVFVGAMWSEPGKRVEVVRAPIELELRPFVRPVEARRTPVVEQRKASSRRRGLVAAPVVVAPMVAASVAEIGAPMSEGEGEGEAELPGDGAEAGATLSPPPDTQAALVVMPRIVYPETARADDVEGVVRLWVKLDARGQVIVSTAHCLRRISIGGSTGLVSGNPSKKGILDGPARDLLNRERAARVTAMNEQKRKEDERLLADKARERQARTIELEQAFAANNLVKVKECIDYLSAESEKLSPSMRDRLATIKSKFAVALVDLQKSFSDELGQAETIDDLKALATKVSASALSEETKTSIKQLIVKRAIEIAPEKTTKPIQLANDRAQWQALNTQLDELRGGMNYGEIARLADKEAAAFRAPEAKAQVQGIATLARLAIKAEAALRVYIGDVNPVVEIVFNNKRTQAKLQSLDERVGFILQEGGNDVEVKHDRRMVGLPLRQLTEKALEDSPVPAAERPIMVAAMLWAWRLPDASAVFATIPDHPLTNAVNELDRKTRVLDLQATVIRTAGDHATVTYDVTKNNPWYTGDFIGDGAQIMAQGLAWTVKTTVTPVDPETALPTLRWKQALNPPFSLTAHVTLQPKTFMLLFGVTSGDRTVRIGFNNTIKGQPSAFALVTKDDGVGFQQMQMPNPTTGKMEIFSLKTPFKTDGPQKVDVRVDADYNVSLLFNGTKLGDLLKLPPGGQITPVIQSLNLKGKEGEVMSTIINSLVLSGTLPPAE